MFTINPAIEPAGQCSIHPRRLCSTAWTVSRCRCNKCVKWHDNYLIWSKGQDREKRLQDCKKWRAELGLADDDIRLYGPGVVTTQHIRIVDPPVCGRTNKAAGSTHCACNVCSGYRIYYYDVTGERLLPLPSRYRKSKRCRKCNKVKSLKEYHYDCTQIDGLKGVCKTCRNTNGSKRRTD